MTRHWHRVLHRYPPQSINRLPPHPATALLPLQACLSFYRLWHLFFLPEPFLRSLLPSFLPTNQRLSELLVLFPSFLLCVYPASSPPVQAQPQSTPCGLSVVLTISTHQPPPPPRFAQRPSLNAVRLPTPHPPPPLSPAPSPSSPLCTKLHPPPPSGSMAQRAAMRSSALDFNVGGTGSTWAFLPNKMFDRRNVLVLSLGFLSFFFFFYVFVF